MNKDVRQEMKKHGVHQWQVAEYLGISEATMCRKMRFELSNDFRESVMAAIRDIVISNAQAKMNGVHSLVIEK